MTRHSILRLSLLAGSLVLTLVNVCSADLRFAPPAKKPTKLPAAKSYTLQVKTGNQNRILLPASLWKQPASTRKGASISNYRTIVAGLALSLAFISMAFLRSNKGRHLVVPALLVLAIGFGASRMLSADIRVPDDGNSRQGLRVLVQSQPRGDEITIFLDARTIRMLIRKPTRLIPPSDQATKPDTREGSAFPEPR